MSIVANLFLAAVGEVLGKLSAMQHQEGDSSDAIQRQLLPLFNSSELLALWNSHTNKY